MKTLRLAILAGVILTVVSTPAWAVDPLPPELENAPLEKKAEWWQRTSNESWEMRTKVAKERYDRAVEYKNQLLAQVQETAAETQARVDQQAATEASALSVDTNNPNEMPTWSIFALLGGIIGGGMAFMQHNLKQAEEPT